MSVLSKREMRRRLAAAGWKNDDGSGWCSPRSWKQWSLKDAWAYALSLGEVDEK